MFTSALEGTFVALTDVLEADFMDEADLRGDLREVHNAVRATEYAVDWVKERPVTPQFLMDLQQMLLRGTAAEGPDTGRLRSVQVFIGAHRRRVHEAHFVPPPPGDQLRMAFEDLVAWIDVRQPMPLLVQAAAAHYQFETLHPPSMTAMDGSVACSRSCSSSRRGCCASPCSTCLPGSRIDDRSIKINSWR